MPDFFDPNSLLNSWISLIAAYISIIMGLIYLLKFSFKHRERFPRLRNHLERVAKSSVNNPWRIAQIQSQVTFRIVLSASTQITMILLFIIWMVSNQEEYRELFILTELQVNSSMILLSVTTAYFTIASAYSLLLLKTAADMGNKLFEKE